MSISDLQTLYIAVYGAILSTIVFFWSVYREIKKSRYNIYVDWEYDDKWFFWSELSRDDRQILEEMGENKILVIRATNKGLRPVTLTWYGIELINGDQYNKSCNNLIGNPFPKTLHEGERVTAFLTSDEWLSSRSKEIKAAFVIDAESKKYYSKKS